MNDKMRKCHPQEDVENSGGGGGGRGKVKEWWGLICHNRVLIIELRKRPNECLYPNESNS